MPHVLGQRDISKKRLIDTEAPWVWQNPLPQGNDLRGASFVDANTGTVVGYYGTIVRTTDGGNSWTIQTSGTTQNLWAVSFTDVNNGTAVGEGGTILRTTDGGGFWVSQASGTTVQFRGVSFTDENNGTTVGEGGGILRTTDGGNTWVPQSSGTANTLLEFRLPMQTTELLWVEQLAKVKSLEQRTEVSTGSASQTQERNSFLTFPSPMQTAERPSVIRAQSSERRTEETLGFLNQAERQKRCTEFRLPTQIMERSVASNSEVRVLSSELQTAETTGLSRHHTHCLKARVHSMQSPLPMQTPEPLLATVA